MSGSPDPDMQLTKGLSMENYMQLTKGLSMENYLVVRLPRVSPCYAGVPRLVMSGSPTLLCRGLLTPTSNDRRSLPWKITGFWKAYTSIL
jgi:hypothetical protein